MQVHVGRFVGLGVCQVVGEEDVGDAVLSHIAAYVLCEVAAVDHVDFLEGIEQVGADGIAEAVFEHEQPATVVGAGGDFDQTVVATAEDAVGRTHILGLEIVEFEEVALLGVALLDDTLPFLVERVDGVESAVVGLARNVAYEVFGRFFDSQVARETIHGAHIVGRDDGVVGVEAVERHLSHTGKFLGGIVGAEWSPMVVGARIDGLVGMLRQRCVDVDRNDGVVQGGEERIDALAFVARERRGAVGHIESCGGGDGHAVDADAGGKRVVVGIDRAGVAYHALAAVGIGADGTYSATVAHNQDALASRMERSVGADGVGIGVGNRAVRLAVILGVGAGVAA